MGFHPKIVIRTFVSSFLWFVCAYSYFGMSLVAPPNIFSSPTLSWIWGFVLEWPAYLAGGLLLESRLGRKMSSCIFLSVAGTLLLGFSFKDSLGESWQFI